MREPYLRTTAKKSRGSCVVIKQMQSHPIQYNVVYLLSYDSISYEKCIIIWNNDIYNKCSDSILVE